MQKPEITLGGEKVALTFNMETWAQMEEEVCTLDELSDRLAGRERLRTMAKIAAIFSGKDEKWVWERIKPAQVGGLSQAITAAINQGMHMEASEGKEDAEVDVVLEEIEKKDGEDG